MAFLSEIRLILEAWELSDREAIDSLLRQRGVQIVPFNSWKRLDDVEGAAASSAPRDKIVDIEAMLEVLAQH